MANWDSWKGHAATFSIGFRKDWSWIRAASLIRNQDDQVASNLKCGYIRKGSQGLQSVTVDIN